MSRRYEIEIPSYLEMRQVCLPIEPWTISAGNEEYMAPFDELHAMVQGVPPESLENGIQAVHQGFGIFFCGFWGTSLMFGLGQRRGVC
jgi:hypothetical protein